MPSDGGRCGHLPGTDVTQAFDLPLRLAHNELDRVVPNDPTTVPL
jgi:hypothetical protein